MKYITVSWYSYAIIVLSTTYLVVVEHTEIEFSGDLKVAMHGS